MFKQYPLLSSRASYKSHRHLPSHATIAGVGLLLPSLIALGVMYLTVIFGDTGFLGSFNAALAAWPIWTWVIVLLGYSYVASVLPVWTLLQPRDYINSLQLISALSLIVLGLAAAALFGYTPTGGEKQTLNMVAPAWVNPKNAPVIFLFSLSPSPVAVRLSLPRLQCTSSKH